MSDKPLTQEEWEKPRAVPERTSIKRLTGEIVDLRAFPRSAEIAADVCGRPPLFTVAYSPKAPQKRLEERNRAVSA